MRRVHETAARGFDTGAQAYERARPGYPADAVDYLVKSLRLNEGYLCLDLAAGTGKLTRDLAGRGVRVVAVEPVEGMREQFRRAVPNVELFDGTAEEIPLESSSIDAVTVAQAFHWFNFDKALAEIHRILRPSGRLALVWNVRDERVDWVSKITAIIDPHQGDVDLPRFRQGRWRAALEASELFTAVERQEFMHTQPMTPDLLIDRILSMSFIATLPLKDRNTVLRQVRVLLASHPDLRGRDEFEHPYVTELYVYDRV